MQVVADQRVFDRARDVGRQRAQHGAPWRGRVGQRHRDPFGRQPLRALPARSAASKKACIAGREPAATVWSFSITSSIRVSASCTLRPHSEPCEAGPKSPIDILSRRAPSVVAAAMPRPSAALSSQPPSAQRPSGLE